MHAVYGIVPGWGYRVQIINRGEVVEEYDSGDCRNDSKVFRTGDLKARGLCSGARKTAKEMLEERGCKKPVLEECNDIVADIKESLGALGEG